MNLALLVHQSAEMYGSDKVLLFLAQGLKAKGEFYPVVIIPEIGPLYDALVASDIEVHVGEVAKISRAIFSPVGLFNLAKKAIKAIKNIDRVVAGRQVAVVHSNTLAVISGAIWACLRDKKHLWHVHEIILSPKLVSKAFPYLVKHLSDKVMSNSTLTEQWLLSEQPALSPKSVVVFNGLPTVIKPSDEDIRNFRKSVGAEPGDLLVTLAGRINRWKGQELLLEAAAELERRGDLGNLRFVIVGGAAPGLEYLPEQLKGLAASAGFGERCSFVSFIDDIWPIWFGTDIAVVPSTEPEPFGMVAIEAMAAGVPVIAAGHGGLLDIVRHDQTGILFPPRDASSLANAIYKLANDEGLRRRLGAAGARRQSELFSVDSQVEKTAQVYRQIC